MMNEQDAKEFIATVFKREKIVKFELKKYPNWPHYPYFNVEFDDKTKIELYETSATWFKCESHDEDISNRYSGMWRLFSFVRLFKRGEVTEETLNKFIGAIENDIESTMEAEIEDRLIEGFCETFEPYMEELMEMDKDYFDYLRGKAETEEEFNNVNDKISKTTNTQLTKVKKLLDNYLDEKVPVTVNEQGELVYNFGFDEERVYNKLTNALIDLDEIRRYHIYLTDQAEEKTKAEKQENIED